MCEHEEIKVECSHCGGAVDITELSDCPVCDELICLACVTGLIVGEDF